MSESTEEKIGLILGKLEGLGDNIERNHEYVREMNHAWREEYQRHNLALEDLREHVDGKDQGLHDRITELEKTKSTVETIVKTLKVTGVTVMTALAYNWKKFFS